jgi:hypothetical protein
MSGSVTSSTGDTSSPQGGSHFTSGADFPFTVTTNPNFPQHQRDTVGKLSRLLTNGDELPKTVEALPVSTRQTR